MRSDCDLQSHGTGARISCRPSVVCLLLLRRLVGSLWCLVCVSSASARRPQRRGFRHEPSSERPRREQAASHPAAATTSRSAQRSPTTTGDSPAQVHSQCVFHPGSGSAGGSSRAGGVGVQSVPSRADFAPAASRRSERETPRRSADTTGGRKWESDMVQLHTWVLGAASRACGCRGAGWPPFGV